MTEEAKVIEVVMFSTKENIKAEDAQKELNKLNDFIVNQKGFISRKTALADDGQYLDLVLWTDLASAQTASDKAIQDPEIAQIFSIIHQEETVFKHFHVFNAI